MKNFQHISLLFLFAIIVFLAHGIIPHSHLTGTIILSAHHSHPEQTNDDRRHNRSLPCHCAIFEHIVLYNQLHIPKCKTESDQDFVFAFLSSGKSVDITGNIPEYNITDHCFYPLRARIINEPLRAPPITA